MNLDDQFPPIKDQDSDYPQYSSPYKLKHLTSPLKTQLEEI